MSTSYFPAGYEKRSFRRFDIEPDVDRLLAEVDGIAENEWLSSYWGHVHCSVGMLLLRGGDTGTETDFYAEDCADAKILEQLPYIRELISDDGPFGRAHYAFLFRMEPNGITHVHQDLIERWFDMYRIHIPIRSNPDAFLVSDNRSIRFAPGHAWSFDNQTDHGVVNGDSERTHLILDVRLNPKLRDWIDRSVVLDGEHVPEHVARIHSEQKLRQSYPGDRVMADAIARLRQRGLADEQIAGFFDHKGVPRRRYSADRWTADMVREVLSPAQESAR